MDNERSGIRNRLRQTQESRIYSTFVLMNSQNKDTIPITICITILFLLVYTTSRCLFVYLFYYLTNE